MERDPIASSLLENGCTTGNVSDRKKKFTVTQARRLCNGNGTIIRHLFHAHWHTVQRPNSSLVTTPEM
jgi:hypothetical protein